MPVKFWPDSALRVPHPGRRSGAPLRKTVFLAVEAAFSGGSTREMAVDRCKGWAAQSAPGVIGAETRLAARGCMQAVSLPSAGANRTWCSVLCPRVHPSLCSHCGGSGTGCRLSQTRERNPGRGSAREEQRACALPKPADGGEGARPPPNASSGSAPRQLGARPHGGRSPDARAHVHGAARRNMAHYRRCAAGFLRCLDASTCVRTTGLGSLPRALLRVTRVRAPSLKSMRVSVIVHAAAVRAPPRYGAAGGSETHTTRGGLDRSNHACERLRVKRSQHPLPYAHSFCGMGHACSLCRHELLPAACTRTIKHTACPARRDSHEAAGEGLGRSTRWTRLITPRLISSGSSSLFRVHLTSSKKVCSGAVSQELTCTHASARVSPRPAPRCNAHNSALGHADSPCTCISNEPRPTSRHDASDFDLTTRQRTIAADRPACLAAVPARAAERCRQQRAAVGQKRHAFFSAPHAWLMPSLPL